MKNHERWMFLYAVGNMVVATVFGVVLFWTTDPAAYALLPAMSRIGLEWGLSIATILCFFSFLFYPNLDLVPPQFSFLRKIALHILAVILVWIRMEADSGFSDILGFGALMIVAFENSGTPWRRKETNAYHPASET